MALNEQIKRQAENAVEKMQSRAMGGSTAASKAKSVSAARKNAATAEKPQLRGAQVKSTLNTGVQRMGTGTTEKQRPQNNSDIFKEPWRYNRDGSRKTFDELSTPEVLTWISTMPQEEQRAAAEEFERDYLKNPGSTRYDPYYTSYSNNDAARQMFGVDVFDQKWIDDNRGYANHLTFTNESYTTPKKPGAKATDEEKAAYQWWLIANDYEQTTQAAESEYKQLRSDVAQQISAMRASGQRVSADEILGGIDWSDYKTLKNMREASAAGNGRMLNRPVQVGDASIRSMVNAAIRGEDVTADGDWVQKEYEWIKSRPTGIQGALENGYKRVLSAAKNTKQAPKASGNPYADVTRVDYDPYYGTISNNDEARQLFGVDTFDQAWIDDNRDLMKYVKFKDEDDTTPIKPDEKASAEEKKAYQYWLIANTYEETTREGEKELQQLQSWMQKKADYLGEDATAQKIVDAIDWKDYPTLSNMRETAAAGNARMVNRAVNAGDRSLMEMAKGVTGEDEQRSGKGGSLMGDAMQAQVEELEALVESLPEGSDERAAAQKELDGLRVQNAGISEEAAEKGRMLGSWQQANKQLGEAAKGWFTNPTAEENKARAQAALAGQQEAAARIGENHDRVQADFNEKRLTEIYGSTEAQAVESVQYNEYVGSMRGEYGLTATENWVQRQIAQLEIMEEISGSGEYDALMEDYRQQLMLLENERVQRELIEERVYEALRFGDVNYWGDGPAAWLKNRDFADAKSDGEMVPLENYEEYLQYRMTPGAYNGDGTMSVRSEMAQYDQTGVWEGRAKLAADAAVQGTAAALNPLGESAEYVTYWLKSKLPEYEGLTREEIYAVDYDLQTFRAFNGTFEQAGMDDAQRQALQEQHPVFSFVAGGIREVIKMGGQGALGGAIGRAVGDVAQGVQRMAGAGEQVIEGLSMLAGNGDKVTAMLQKAGSYLPFALDAYAGSFEQALNEGANADQAMLAGFLNGAVSGTLSGAATNKLTQAGKGLFGRLFGSQTAQKAAQKGAAKAAVDGIGDVLVSLFSTAVEEGMEEALEEVIGGGIAKAVYDRDRAWFGEGGVFDPTAMLESGIAGAVAGGMYPVVSGAGSVISDRRAAKAEAERAAAEQRRGEETAQRINVAAQHVFEVLSGYSGELGEAVQAKADSIIQRIAEGENVAESEFDELREMAARSASVEDAAEAIESENNGAVEAANEAADKAEETAQKAEQGAAEAQRAFDESKAAVKPTIQALNEGSASYNDPKVQETLTEQYKAAKAAKGALDKANTQAQQARTAADEAAQAAKDTEARVRSEARTQAQTQVDAEMQTEAKEAAQAAEENKKQMKKRPKGDTQPGARKMYSGKLDRTKQTQVRILDALGREYGIEFDIVDSIGNGISAMYDRSQAKVITVALDASEGAIVQAGVHEMVHYIKSQSADAYTLLEGTVLRELAKKMDSEALENMINERIELYKERTGQELTREDALEEIIAEAVPTVFTDKEAMAQLIKENRTLVEQVRDFFIDFANKLREIAERYWDKNERYEIAALIDEADSLREIAYALDDALDAVSEGADGSGEESARFSLNKEGDGKMPVYNGDVPMPDAETMRRIKEADANAPHVGGYWDTEATGDSETAYESGETSETEADTQEMQTDDAAASEKKSKAKKGSEKELAGRIVRKYKSDVERGKVRTAIAMIEDAYNNGEAEEAERLAADIARQIAEESRSAVSEESAEQSEKREAMREQYAETRKMLQKKGISLTDVQKQEAAKAYGSYNDFRRSMMGNVLIKNEGVSLDAVWSELSAMHPEMFPAETSEGDMVGKLAEFVEQVRPGKKTVGGMDAGTMAAVISLEIQSEVLREIGKEAEAVSAEMAAQALKENGLKRAAIRKEAQREARRGIMREIAQEIRTARDAKDDAALSAALTKYREKMGKAIREKPAAIISIGMDIRAKEQDVAKIQRQIELLQAEGGIDDTAEGIDSRIADTVHQIEMLQERLESEQKSLRELHRQQMIERTRARLQNMDEDGVDIDEMDAVAEEIAQQDLADYIERLQTENHEKILTFTERMRAKQADFSATSTLTTEDIDDFFLPMLSEMKQNSALARDFERSISGWKYQLEEDQILYRDLKGELAALRPDGDPAKIEEISREADAARDRIDVWRSKIRHGEQQAKNFRKSGAQSMHQALREGKLSQPIMEWVLSACSGTKRQMSRFNANKVVKGGLEAIRLNMTTAARVWDDLFGETAPVMRAIYYDPVMDNETSRQKWIAEWREKIRALKLTESESTLVQLIGEGIATPTERRNASKKVMDAVKVFKQFYAEAYNKASDALVRNGYKKPGHIREYFPHFEKPRGFWDELGIPLDKGSLPTVINGLTETFTPGKQFSTHLLHREGETTDYDALFGFEDYVDAISNVIYHTDDIQRLRQLETEIRTAAESGLLDGNKRTTHLSEFVKWVHEYTNLLAGKKSQLDRGAEGTAGRVVYRSIMKLKSIKGASAVCGNIASALTNFVPITQVAAEHPKAFAKAVGQCFFERAVSKSNLATSDYIARKYGSDSVIETTYSKAMKTASWLFDAVDHIATNAVVYTYYQANMDMGMDSETAMRSADSKAARLMGDRSKGAMPTAYGSQLLGLFTQFQYEIANQSQHFRKDIWRGKSRDKAWLTLIGTMITGWLFNNLQEAINGRRSAADPIQIALDAYDAWQEKGEPMAIAQSLYNSVSEMVPYSSLGGRIAAFEGFQDVIDAFASDDSTLAYAVSDAIFGMIPTGGQLKKTVAGVIATIEGGVYNNKGDQLKYVVEWDEAVRAWIFGPSATPAGRAYFEGDAPGLTKKQTEAFEQAKQRGYSGSDAYRNEADKAKAAKLMTDVQKAEGINDENEARRKAGLSGAEDVDMAKAEKQREEAEKLRSEAMPGEQLSDYWYGRRNRNSVKAGIELWRKTGESWSLPKSYEAETAFTIDGKTRYPGKKIAEEANRMYAEGYEEIMGSVKADRLDKDGMKELKKQLSKLKSEVDDWAKDEIIRIQGE